MEPIIKIENLSKMYRLGLIGTGTISHDLNRWWHNVRGKENPYLKIGEANLSNNKSISNYVWALKDINLEVLPGEVLGIIGKNGAGKSTLLKILSKVTGPTTGSIKYKGRIGSLLEVGTGFHRELTGRENIFLNGAILGMTKIEIQRKLDEIVDFSGVERYIDTPVKRYSSGMMVRLGFAVAAHLEPEILVVDEVLAVGDAEFQKKALNKMQDVSKNEGRTVLFVSHNMASVKNICTTGVVLGSGQNTFKGTSEEAVKFYLEGMKKNSSILLEERKDRKGNGRLKFIDIQMLDEHGKTQFTVISGSKVVFKFHFVTNSIIEKPLLGITIVNNNDTIVSHFATDEMDVNIDVNNNNIFYIKFNKLQLRAGNYSINIFSHDTAKENREALDHVLNAFSFEVIAGDYWEVGNTNRGGNYPIIEAEISTEMLFKNDKKIS